jgi:hypothetical protein
MVFLFLAWLFLCVVSEIFEEKNPARRASRPTVSAQEPTGTPSESLRTAAVFLQIALAF